jgi:hypothetical protein
VVLEARLSVERVDRVLCNRGYSRSCGCVEVVAGAPLPVGQGDVK